MKLETYEKLILHRNFRAALGESLGSSFEPGHLKHIHERLCRGLEHRDNELCSGELKVANGAVGLLSHEAQKMATGVMASVDPRYIAERSAYVLKRIEAMAPFHSFNSMVGKLFAHNLAQTAGYNIDWKNIDAASFNRATDEAMKGGKDSLANLIEKSMQPMYQSPKAIAQEKERFGERVTAFRSQQVSFEPEHKAKLRL